MRILLVEDKTSIEDSVALGLKSAGYAVDVAAASPVAFLGISVFDFDIIIVDFHVSRLGVIDFIRQIRHETERIPILILTSLDVLAIKLLYFELGVDDYVVKPVALGELLARVTALLRRGSTAGANILTISDLKLDRYSHRVCWCSEEIRLTQKEYLVLEYLMLHADRIVSRKAIVEHVWEQSLESAGNIVDVYIRQLRKKIDKKYNQRLIHTLRGSGYSIGTEGGQGKQSNGA